MEAHKYGCLMAVVPSPLSATVLSWASKSVDKNHLAFEDLEDKPHVTILYGFKDPSPALARRVFDCIAPYGPIKVKLTGLSLFEGVNQDDGSTADCLKVDVASPTLHALNGIAQSHFDCHVKFPEYKPHLTLAYLQPRHSQLYKYLKPPFLGEVVWVTELVYSTPDGQRFTCNLAPAGVGKKGMKMAEKRDKVDAELDAQWDDADNEFRFQRNDEPFNDAVARRNQRHEEISQAIQQLQDIERQNQGGKGTKTFFYRKKNADRDRERILSSLGEGDHTAIHALHDWHQDNPGHEQEQDVAHLRDYVSTDVERHEDPQYHWHNYDDRPQVRSQERARSAHAHLTGKEKQPGDLIAMTITQEGHPQQGYHYASGRMVENARNPPTHISYSQPYQDYLTGMAAGAHHHATYWLNQRKQEQQQKQGEKAYYPPGTNAEGRTPIQQKYDRIHKIADAEDREPEYIHQARQQLGQEMRKYPLDIESPTDHDYAIEQIVANNQRNQDLIDAQNLVNDERRMGKSIFAGRKALGEPDAVKPRGRDPVLDSITNQQRAVNNELERRRHLIELSGQIDEENQGNRSGIDDSDYPPYREAGMTSSDLRGERNQLNYEEWQQRRKLEGKSIFAGRKAIQPPTIGQKGIKAQRYDYDLPENDKVRQSLVRDMERLHGQQIDLEHTNRHLTGTDDPEAFRQYVQSHRNLEREVDDRTEKLSDLTMGPGDRAPGTLRGISYENARERRWAERDRQKGFPPNSDKVRDWDEYEAEEERYLENDYGGRPWSEQNERNQYRQEDEMIRKRRQLIAGDERRRQRAEATYQTQQQANQEGQKGMKGKITSHDPNPNKIYDDMLDEDIRTGHEIHQLLEGSPERQAMQQRRDVILNDFNDPRKGVHHRIEGDYDENRSPDESDTAPYDKKAIDPQGRTLLTSVDPNSLKIDADMEDYHGRIMEARDAVEEDENLTPLQRRRAQRDLDRRERPIIQAYEEGHHYNQAYYPDHKKIKSLRQLYRKKGMTSKDPSPNKLRMDREDEWDRLGPSDLPVEPLAPEQLGPHMRIMLEHVNSGIGAHDQGNYDWNRMEPDPDNPGKFRITTEGGGPYRDEKTLSAVHAGLGAELIPPPQQRGMVPLKRNKAAGTEEFVEARNDPQRRRYLQTEFVDRVLTNGEGEPIRVISGEVEKGKQPESYRNAPGHYQHQHYLELGNKAIGPVQYAEEHTGQDESGLNWSRALRVLPGPEKGKAPYFAYRNVPGHPDYDVYLEQREKERKKGKSVDPKTGEKLPKEIADRRYQEIGDRARADEEISLRDYERAIDYLNGDYTGKLTRRQQEMADRNANRRETRRWMENPPYQEGKGMTSSDPNSRKIQDDMDAEDESIERQRFDARESYNEDPEHWRAMIRSANRREDRLAQAEQEGHHEIRGEYDQHRMENVHGPVQRRENQWYDEDEHNPSRGAYRITTEGDGPYRDENTKSIFAGRKSLTPPPVPPSPFAVRSKAISPENHRRWREQHHRDWEWARDHLDMQREGYTHRDHRDVLRVNEDAPEDAKERIREADDLMTEVFRDQEQARRTADGPTDYERQQLAKQSQANREIRERSDEQGRRFAGEKGVKATGPEDHVRALDEAEAQLAREMAVRGESTIGPLGRPVTPGAIERRARSHKIDDAYDEYVNKPIHRRQQQQKGMKPDYDDPASVDAYLQERMGAAYDRAIERSPVGIDPYGVAPNHPEVRRFNRTMEHLGRREDRFYNQQGQD